MTVLVDQSVGSSMSLREEENFKEWGALERTLEWNNEKHQQEGWGVRAYVCECVW